MKPTGILLFMSTCMLAVFSLSGCDDGKHGIAYDAGKAEKHIISLRKADSYVRNFQSGKDTLHRMADSLRLKGVFEVPYSETFNRDAIALLLNQDGADGIRIYLGRDSAGLVRMVLLPVDAAGKDIRKILLDKSSLTSKAGTQLNDGFSEDTGQAIEVGQRCPTMCN
ncbi:MAG: hypothetical protein ABW019_13815 [Chitinophagaceae bacterium]